MSTPEPRPESSPDRKLLPLPAGARVILGNPSDVLGKSWAQMLAWLVLLAAAGVDVATFYQVLILVMNAPDEVVWGAVVGFVAVALTLAHFVGTRCREARSPGGYAGATISAWLCFAIWSALGCTAFVVRWFVQPADVSGGSDSSTFIVDDQSSPVDLSGQTTSQHLSALLFLVLYAATGMVAAMTGFTKTNPAARRWGPARRQRTKAARRYAAVQFQLTTALQMKDAVGRERKRRENELADARATCDEAATRVRQEARLMLRGLRRPMTDQPADDLDTRDDRGATARKTDAVAGEETKKEGP